jgi:hypothetical protein
MKFIPEEIRKFLSSRGDKSKTIGARVMNIVT